MTFPIETSRFPKLDKGVQAHWAPLVLEPISGSVERLVIGVAAVGEMGFHLEIANSLDRLSCFFGSNAGAIFHAVQLAEKYLVADLAERSLDALREPRSPTTGVYFGECRRGEGHSLQQLAEAWLSSMSSLHDTSRHILNEVGAGQLMQANANETVAIDRLPDMVHDYVASVREGYGKYFSASLRERSKRRPRNNSYTVQIDYAGPKLVANFGTLKATTLTNSVYLIKRRLWDLKVERDREPSTALERRHEMILHRPAEDDPQISHRQAQSIKAALDDLEEQADQEHLRLVAMDSVSAIGDRIMKIEMAA